MLALFVATAAWGASFFLVKKATALVGVWPFLFYRFSGAVILLSAMFPKKVFTKKGFHGSTSLIWRGLFLGLLLFVLLWAQAKGLQLTTATKSGFITALYVPLTPIMGWLLLRRALVARQMAVAALSFLGLYLLTGASSQHWWRDVNQGDLWTFVCASFAAIHIIFTGQFSKHEPDSYGLGLWQFIGCWIATGAACLAQSQTSYGGLSGNWNLIHWPHFAIFALVFIAVFCTAFGFMAQIVAQRSMNPLKAALIFALEAPISSGLSYVFLNETMNFFEFCGALIVFLTSIIPEKWLTRTEL